MNDTDEEGQPEILGTKWNWLNLPLIGLGFAANVAGDVHRLFAEVGMALGAHLRHTYEQDQFRQRITHDIESL